VKAKHDEMLVIAFLFKTTHII